MTPTLPKGKWELIATSDDGVRVFVDGEKVIDNWTWHHPTVDRASVSLDAGPHHIRVEHFELDGWAELKLEIQGVPAK